MKFDTTIFCDDVRKEDGGKPFLIGVYLQTILIPEFPAILPLTVWIQFHVSKNGKTEFEFRFLKDRKVTASGGGKANTKDFRKQITLTIHGIPLDFDKPCILSFQMREKGRKWSTLKKIPVGLHEAVANAVSSK